MTAKEFFSKYAYDIIEAVQGTGLLASVKIAQAALESGYGKTIITGNNNMFGIKASGQKTPFWNGNAKLLGTTEVINGKTVNINDAFRAYSNIGDSIKDHTYFLISNKRYKSVLDAKTPEEQAAALQSAGYATDPDYASKLINIINKYNLKEYDKKKR